MAKPKTKIIKNQLMGIKPYFTLVFRILHIKLSRRTRKP